MPEPVKEGVLFVTIADKALDMKNVSSVKIKILSASVYHKDKEYWTTVSDEDVVIDLLQLKADDVEKIYGNKSLPEGEFSQVKLKVADVKVTVNGKEQDAFLPSGELKMQVPVVVEADRQSLVTIDFVADESLHVTGDGKIIFAPVIHARSKKDIVFSEQPKGVRVSKETPVKAAMLSMNDKGELGAEKLDVKKDWTIEGNKVVERKPAEKTRIELPHPTTSAEKSAAMKEAVVEIAEGEKKVVVIQDKK
ncbi:DUF4382 domain-containing protein [Candidatus Woesearchaeota archaeon]|nr:DUF4382 domain-containing protein [Candidatus Woesearchaeota archaeon]